MAELLKAVAYERDGFWFAVLLDHYQMTYTRSREDLPGKLRDMLSSYVAACEDRGLEPWGDTEKAPERHWARLDHVEDEVEIIEPLEGEGAPSFPAVELSWGR